MNTHTYHEVLSSAQNPEKQMTPDREVHLDDLKTRFTKALDQKYRKGQTEHGGNVWERDPLADAEGEILDLWVYHECMRRKIQGLNDLAARAQHALAHGDAPSLQLIVDEIFDQTVVG